MSVRLGLAATVLLALAAIAPGPAGATFPGRNGWITIGYGDAEKYPDYGYHYAMDALNPRTGKRIRLLDCGRGSSLDHPGPARCRAQWPAWAPDGRTLAFADAPQSSPWGIGFMVLGRHGFERVTMPSDVGRLAWSPDGNRLVFDRGVPPAGPDDPGSSTLATVSRTGGEVTALGTGNSWDPDWSSRGVLAYTSGTEPCGPGSTCDVYTLRPGGSPRLVARGGFAPSWSPDGKQLAYTRRRHDRPEQVMLVRPGRRPRALTRKGGTGPMWSPDGRWIAFSRAASTSSDGGLFLVRPSGRDLQLVFQYADDEFTATTFVQSFAWRPRR